LVCWFLRALQERIPDAKNMFSEIGRFPRAGYRLPHKQELPRHMEGQAMHPEAAPAAPSPVARRSIGASMSVTGSDRHKYFHQPTGGAETGGILV
jgi:hypothetical protein